MIWIHDERQCCRCDRREEYRERCRCGRMGHCSYSSGLVISMPTALPGGGGEGDYLCAGSSSMAPETASIVGASSGSTMGGVSR